MRNVTGSNSVFAPEIGQGASLRARRLGVDADAARGTARPNYLCFRRSTDASLPPRVDLPIWKKLGCHFPPKRGGIIEFERIFKLRWRAVGFPELCVCILVFENREHACRDMIENVTVIGSYAWVVGIEDNLDCGFRRDKDGVPFRA